MDDKPKTDVAILLGLLGKIARRTARFYSNCLAAFMVGGGYLALVVLGDHPMETAIGHLYSVLLLTHVTFISCAMRTTKDLLDDNTVTARLVLPLEPPAVYRSVIVATLTINSPLVVGLATGLGLLAFRVLTDPASMAVNNVFVARFPLALLLAPLTMVFAVNAGIVAAAATRRPVTRFAANVIAVFFFPALGVAALIAEPFAFPDRMQLTAIVAAGAAVAAAKSAVKSRYFRMNLRQTLGDLTQIGTKYRDRARIGRVQKIVVGLLACAFLCRLFVPDTFHPLTNVTYLGHPSVLYLTFGVLALIAFFRDRRVPMLIFTLAAFAAQTAHVEESTLTGFPKSVQKSNLRTDALDLVLWNVMHGVAGSKKIAAVAKLGNPHIVGLVEAPAPKAGGPDPLEELLVDYAIIRKGAGIALAYDRHLLAPEDEPKFHDLAGHGKVLEADFRWNIEAGGFEPPEFRIYVVDCHHTLIAARTERFRELERIVRSAPTDRIVVVMGDFNVPRDSGFLEPIRRAGFANALETAYSGLDGTWPVPLNLYSIDHIWVRGAEIVSADKTATPFSDHARIEGSIRVTRRSGIPIFRPRTEQSEY